MTEKKLFLILMIMLFIPLVSCGTSEQDEEKEMKEETSVETEEMENEIESEESDEHDMKKEEKTENQEEDEEEATEPDEGLVAMGKDVYKNKGCVACHTIGKGKLVGPDLLGVTERRSEDWLSRWMLNPDEMLKTDPIAKEMLKEHMVPMPNQGLTEKEVKAIIAYMKHEDMKN